MNVSPEVPFVPQFPKAPYCSVSGISQASLLLRGQVLIHSQSSLCFQQCSHYRTQGSQILPTAMSGKNVISYKFQQRAPLWLKSKHITPQLKGFWSEGSCRSVCSEAAPSRRRKFAWVRQWILAAVTQSQMCLCWWMSNDRAWQLVQLRARGEELLSPAPATRCH